MAEISNNILNACMNNQIGVKYFPIPNFNNNKFNSCSIVDALKSVGYPNDKGYRLKIGQRNNITETPFTATYNAKMLKLMKEGRLIIP